MPIPPEIRNRLARRHESPHTTARGDSRHHLVRTALACWGWAVTGLGFVAWALTTTHQGLAEIAFWAGLAIGNGGVIFTLLAAYRRGEQRGDW
jgi:hypothetical protein